MRNKTILLIIIISLAATFAGGCVKRNPDSDKPVIAVSIVPLETFVREIAGDMYDIVTLVPPGYSPENYQPSPLLMEKLSKAEIYFSIGLPTEKASILPELKDMNKNVKVVDLSEIVAETYPPLYFEEAHSHGDDEDGLHEENLSDPHIWLSPKRVVAMLEAIADELTHLNSDKEDLFSKNSDKYINEIQEMDSDIKEMLADIPSRSFFIYHPSLGYFADEYNLEMIALEKEGKEVTAANLQGFVDLALEKNIKVIFYQAENSSRQTNAFAEEIGGRAMELDPLSGNYVENMREMAKIFLDVLKESK